MLALYQGKSLFSRLIRFITWSKYSHVSWITRKGLEYEAWQIGNGYQKVKFGKNHTKGTVVDLYTLKGLTYSQRKKAEELMEKMVNQIPPIKYDFIGCTRFLTKINRGDNSKLFCSEAFVSVFNRVKYFLFGNIEPWKISPAMISYSPKTEYVATIKIGDEITKYLINEK